MNVYIDSDFKCHATNDGTMTEVQTNFFDGKCDAFIEGYRFVPAGQTWTREDGVVFNGEMVTPWTDYKELDAAQRQYEREQLADMKAALLLLGVNADEQMDESG